MHSAAVIYNACNTGVDLVLKMGGEGGREGKVTGIPAMKIKLVVINDNPNR